MSALVETIQGIYDHGQVRLLDNIKLDMPYLVKIIFVRPLTKGQEWKISETLAEVAFQRKQEMASWFDQRRVTPQHRQRALDIVGIADDDQELPVDTASRFREYLYGTEGQ